MTMSDRASRAAWIAGALDLALVAVFALIGRSTHDSALLSLEYLATLWPFAAGLALGWALTRAWLRPYAPVRAGVGIWLCTVGGGMILRAASDQGTALPFVIVATAVLGLVLVGWRLLAQVLTRGPRQYSGHTDV